MIAYPPALALVLVSGVSAGFMLWAATFAWRLLRRWNPSSGSAEQIGLERRTYLVSTVVAFVMALEILALILFAFAADRMSVLFVGAMCALGTLNASPFGFPALFAKLALFFGAAVWLVLDHADRKGRDYPFVRLKYRLLLGLAPLALLEAALSASYFIDLRADTVTSCCGKIFAAGKATIGGEMAALDPRASLWLLFGGLAGAVAIGFAATRNRRALALFGVASAGFFVIAIAAIISAISVYVYEQPQHHCPFCLLKAEYGYFGFLLYAPLFAGAALGVASGVLGAIETPSSLAVAGPALERRLVVGSMACFLAFGALALLAITRSHLILVG
jgi:hypothetical protein